MKAAGRHSSPQLSVRYRQLNPLWVLSLLSAYLMGTAFRLQFSTERKKNKSKHWSPWCRCPRSCPSAPTSLVEKWMGSQSHVKHPPDLTSHLNTWASHQDFFNHQQSWWSWWRVLTASFWDVSSTVRWITCWSAYFSLHPTKGDPTTSSDSSTLLTDACTWSAASYTHLLCSK